MKAVALIIVLFISSLSFSQGVLTFEEVIQKTLEYNFDIRIVRNSAEQIANLNNIGNAGYLPKVSVNADQNFGVANTRQEFISGQVNDVNGAKSQALSANMRLDWTFFDGFTMFAADKRLQLQEDAATLNVSAQVEMTLYQVSVLYHSIQLQSQMTAVFEEALELTRQRFQLLTLKRKNGAASELALLQAKMDLASDSANLIAQQKSIREMKLNLALLMGNAREINFNLSTASTPQVEINRASISKQALDQNTTLLIEKSNVAIRDMQRKELQGRYFPQLNLYGQYAFGTSQSQAGFLVSNRSLGPSFGISLKWNILDRLSTFTELKNNSLQQEVAALYVEKKSQMIANELQAAFDNYDYAKQLYELDQNSLLDAEEIYVIARKSYVNGAITDLELREIQFSVIQTKNRQLSATLALQTSILDLWLLSGDFKKML
ncbi:MAG: TolC family protein [Crocinitomicaceae bacterium]